MLQKILFQVNAVILNLAGTFIESDLKNRKKKSLNIQGFKESSWSPQNIKQNNHFQH